MSTKRKKTPDQPELPIVGAKPSKNAPAEAAPAKAKPARGGTGNGETHVLAEEVETIARAPFSPAKIEQPLHGRASCSMPPTSFATAPFRT